MTIGHRPEAIVFDQRPRPLRTFMLGAFGRG